MRETFLSFSPPNLGEEEIQEVVDTLRSPWITTGPKTRAFEQEFASFLGAPSALALASCTAGLHVALATLGIGPGDEVVTTPMTFAASVNVIEHVGATPVLADVEPDTLNIDPDNVARAITARTRAIIPVHYSGHPAELDPIADLAGDRIAVVEDAAHSLPASYRGRVIGSGPNPVAFSFYATKNLATAEGGMLTGDPDMLNEARVLSLHGMSRDAWNRYAKGGSWFYEITAPGFKYNMTDIQASLGKWQLRKLPDMQARRRAIVSMYTDALSTCDAFELPVERAHVEHAWHLYVVRLRPDVLSIDRDQFIREMDARSIGCSVHFIPIHLHPFYRDKYGYKPEAFPVAYENYRRAFSIPLHPGLTDADVNDVVNALLDIVKLHRR